MMIWSRVMTEERVTGEPRRSESRRKLRRRTAGYLEAFAHGMPPHGAIGLERWAGRLTQAENIREVTLFPRDRHRLTP
jgi:nondiscriminating aspartyl-tRNA synthetase